MDWLANFLFISRHSGVSVPLIYNCLKYSQIFRPGNPTIENGDEVRVWMESGKINTNNKIEYSMWGHKPLLFYFMMDI